jgi:hypothetical protein
VVEVANGKLLDEREVAAVNWTHQERAERLAALGVDTVICGGIDMFSARGLALRRVQVYCWITGEVDDALHCFLRGEMSSHLMIGHGGRCCGRWRFGAGRRRAGGPPGTRREQGGVKMPRGDGTGPLGRGPGTGRGMGGGRGQGRGRMGGPSAAGPGGECICPSCGGRVPHVAGQPCNQRACPKCGATMTRG